MYIMYSLGLRYIVIIFSSIKQVKYPKQTSSKRIQISNNRHHCEIDTYNNNV